MALKVDPPADDSDIERRRVAEIEGSAALLRTISDVLDVRTVFPRISEIAKTMKIKPNYLYRVLGELEKEGRVKKKGRQYQPAKSK